MKKKIKKNKKKIFKGNGVINFFFNNYQALPFGNKISVLYRGYKKYIYMTYNKI
jgi:hypothetical protein